MSDRYEVETLDEDHDNGTMPSNVDILREAVIGHRIVKVEKKDIPSIYSWGSGSEATVIILDNGKEVQLVNTDDCCAYTALNSFLLHPELVDHEITGIGTTDEYTTWHIFADMGDVLELHVGWSSGNPFYYGYGFDIRVEEVGS
jgi:hypothetical protein